MVAGHRIISVPFRSDAFRVGTADLGSAYHAEGMVGRKCPGIVQLAAEHVRCIVCRRLCDGPVLSLGSIGLSLERPVHEGGVCIRPVYVLGHVSRIRKRSQAGECQAFGNIYRSIPLYGERSGIRLAGGLVYLAHEVETVVRNLGADSSVRAADGQISIVRTVRTVGIVQLLVRICEIGIVEKADIVRRRQGLLIAEIGLYPEFQPFGRTRVYFRIQAVVRRAGLLDQAVVVAESA